MVWRRRPSTWERQRDIEPRLLLFYWVCSVIFLFIPRRELCFLLLLQPQKGPGFIWHQPVLQISVTCWRKDLRCWSVISEVLSLSWQRSTERQLRPLQLECMLETIHIIASWETWKAAGTESRCNFQSPFSLVLEDSHVGLGCSNPVNLNSHFLIQYPLAAL